jgi:hypothetical protein
MEEGLMGEVMTVSRSADFDWRCVVGAVDTDAGDYAWEGPMFGLPLSQTFLYGSVRDAEGVIWTPMRRLAAGDGGRERLLLQTDLESDAIHVHRAGRSSARSLGVRRALDGGAVRFDSDPAAPGSAFHVRADATTFSWTEDGTLDVRGAAVPPGLHWHLPDRQKGMYYLSQIYEVEGTVLGRDVRGFIPLDQLWMNGRVYVDDILVGEAGEVAWYTCATRYVDGSFEGGHFMVGHRQLGFAIVYDETGRVTATTEVDGQVVLDDGGPWPERIEVSAAGQAWEFLPAPTGRMVDLMPIPNPQIEGRWRRVGDTREPAHWFAWGEVAPGHGTAPNSEPMQRGDTVLP